MRNTNQKTLRLAQLAILIALEAVLTFTPLGFILVPPISITLMHIPVIVGAVLMGPVDGGILGLSFGVFSMIKASTAAASPADMAFSPFLSGEPVSSIVMCIIPRRALSAAFQKDQEWRSVHGHQRRGGHFLPFHDGTGAAVGALPVPAPEGGAGRSGGRQLPAGNAGRRCGGRGCVQALAADPPPGKIGGEPPRPYCAPALDNRTMIGCGITA